MVHPSNLHREMIKCFSSLNKLIPYIDMPTQHGSDKILKDMRRGLDSNGIKKRINDLRKTNKNMSIRTTVIVGFPGEGDKEFQELYDFVNEVKFDRLGVFKYSEEEGTHGAEAFKDDKSLQKFSKQYAKDYGPTNSKEKSTKYWMDQFLECIQETQRG